MSYLLNNNGEIYMANFNETSDNQFSFLATNSKAFLIENVSSEDLMVN